jgi:hypothetical protein
VPSRDQELLDLLRDQRAIGGVVVAPPGDAVGKVYAVLYVLR